MFTLVLFTVWRSQITGIKRCARNDQGQEIVSLCPISGLAFFETQPRNMSVASPGAENLILLAVQLAAALID